MLFGFLSLFQQGKDLKRELQREVKDTIDGFLSLFQQGKDLKIDLIGGSMVGH